MHRIFLGWWKVSEFDSSVSWICIKYQSDPVWKKEITISHRSFSMFLLTLETFYFRQLGVITRIYCSLEFERERCRKIIKLLKMLIMLSKFYLYWGIICLDSPEQNPNWKMTDFESCFQTWSACMSFQLCTVESNSQHSNLCLIQI